MEQHSHQHRHNGVVLVPEPCPHLSDFRSRHGGAKPFRALQDCLRVRPPGRAAIRRDPDELPRCICCGLSSPPAPRLYACVSCAAVSCIAHAPSHAAGDGGHQIAVDVDRAELFCCLCKDQVYDRDFDAAVVLAQTAASTLGGGGGGSNRPPPPENLRKRRRVDYRPWTPDPRERALVVSNTSPLNGETTSLPWGLRGLNNLGNTCFMNSVLQALLHTPPLRNYFLSDKHNRYFCQQQKNNSTAKKNDNKNSRLCLACDMDAIFSAVFLGERTTYSPAKFLYSWWQHAANLASYEQQDAHEFFISMLDGIHEKVEKDKRKPQSQGSHLFKWLMPSPWGVEEVKTGLNPLEPSRYLITFLTEFQPTFIKGQDRILSVANLNENLRRKGNGDCCIAHRVFCGILRSDVMCAACGFTSTTYDPCVDISLDLEPNQVASTKKPPTKSPTKSVLSCSAGSDSMYSSQSCGISTLMGCLDRFTRPERLGSDQKFFCQRCQVKQESLKQMSIRKLPLVSCFHIKRFEHSPVRKMSRKVDRYLQFPFSLDMAPYLSSSILRGRFGNRIFSFDGDEPDGSSELSSEFELFAVITHTGKLEAGHYVTYLRLSNQWYKCDDAWITQVNEDIVRAAQGYMIFYVQKMLYYKASEKPVAL